MRQVGVTPLTYHVGEQVTAPPNRDRTRGPGRFPPAALSNNRLQAIPETIRTCRQQTQPAWQGLVTVTPGWAAPHTVPPHTAPPDTVCADTTPPDTPPPPDLLRR